MNDEGTAANGTSPVFYPEEHTLKAMADRNNIVIEKKATTPSALPSVSEVMRPDLNNQENDRLAE